MKIAVVSYSLTGNNEALAKSIAEEFAAEHIKIIEPKTRTMVTIIMDLIFNRIPKVQPMPDRLKNYDLILFLGPVWMGKVATPLRAYLKHVRTNTCRYAFISISGGAIGPNPKLAGELKKRAWKEPIALVDMHIADLLPSDPKPTLKVTSAYQLNKGDIDKLTNDVVITVRETIKSIRTGDGSLSGLIFVQYFCIILPGDVKMARLPRKQSESAIYHVMLRGNEKRNIFHDDEDRTKFIEILRTKKEDNSFELYSYCLMDNHVHLLISEKSNSIGRIMKCINVSYAYYFNRKYNRVGHLFQDRFRSEVIDGEVYLLTAARYIHNNPVKASIVDTPEGYEWSSYRNYSSGINPYGLVDSYYLLGLFSLCYDIAVKKFVEYTEIMCDEKFIDVHEEKDKEILTKNEAIEYLEKLLAEKGISLQEVQQQSGRVKGSFKHELVVKLKKITNLSCRDIGALLGINKSTVQELN